GIAAGLAQDLQFIVHTTPATVGAGVIQCPVAVNEAVSDLLAVARARQQAVPIGEEGCVAQQGLSEVFGTVVVVMQVNLNFAKALAAEFGEGIDVTGLVLVDRKEERVLRGTTIT